LPIIYLSAFTDLAHQLDARQAGGEDYLVKPVDARLLVAAVLARTRQFRLFEAAQFQRRQAEASLRASHETLEQQVAARTALLADSEARFRNLVEASPDWVWETDGEGRYTYVGPQVAQILGYAPDELLGHTPFDLMPEDEAQRVSALFTKIVAAQRPFGHLGNTNLHRNGQRVILETNGVPIFDAQGALVGYRGVDRDVTERQRTERELRNSSALLRTVIDESPDIILMKDWDGRFLLGNRTLAGLYGTTPENLVGKSDGDFNPNQEQVAFFLENIRSVIRSGQTQVVQETSTDASSGEVRYFQSIKKPLRGPDDDPRILVIATDITEIRRAQAEVEASAKRLTYALEATGEGVWDWDIGSNVVKHNAQWCHLLSLNAEFREHPVEDFIGLLHPEDRERAMQAVAQCLREDVPYASEHRMRRHNGSVIWVEDRGRVVERTPQGEPLRMVGSMRDISERKAMVAELQAHRDHLEELVTERTRQLEAARDEAERLARVKSEFLANMSHEIRTPLNAILGFAKIGARESLGHKAGKTCQHILDSAQHLLGVVNDILDYSKLESGKLEIDACPFRLASALKKAMGLLAERADAKGLPLHVSLSSELPEWVIGDSLRLQQILINLLTNAVKFTEKGEVSLSVLREGDKTLFRISDTGLGINSEDLARLFAPFEQADSSTTRKFGGTGLGLAISLKLAHMMGGDISAQSTPGQGSIFTLALPLPLAAAGDETARASAASGLRLSGLRFLAAEDVAVNRLLLEDILLHEGAQVVFAEHGLQAVEHFAAAGANAFDAILMDVQMPKMDGYEASRRILQINPNVPIIGLSAHALSEHRDKCLAAGMVDQLTKPIDDDLLVTTILKHVARGTTSAGTTSTATDQAHADSVPLPPAATTAVSASSPLPGKSELIDRTALLNRYEGRQAFIDKIFASVLATHRELPAKLRAAIDAKDREILRFEAHKLKSLGGNLEAKELQAQAIATEAALRDSRSDTDEIAGKLVDLLSKLLDEIDTLAS
jgi:PAS domain S-box-containing protein